MGVVQLGVVQLGVVQMGIVQLGVVQVQLGSVQMGVVQLGVVQLGVVQMGVDQFTLACAFVGPPPFGLTPLGLPWTTPIIGLPPIGPRGQLDYAHFVHQCTCKSG